MLTIRNASEGLFFGRAGGKDVSFDTEKTKRKFFGGTRKVRSSIRIQIESATPEGGKDSWWFTGHVVSKKGSIKEGTLVKGFYIGSNGRTDLGWGNEPNTGWVEPA